MSSMSALTCRARTRAPRARIAGPIVVGLLASFLLLLPSAAAGAQHLPPQGGPGSIPDLSAAALLAGGPGIVPTDDEDEGDENEGDENDNEGDENENEPDENERDDRGGELDEGGCRDFDDGEDRCLDETAVPALETTPVSASGSEPDLRVPVAALGLGGLTAGAVALARRRRPAA